MLLEIKDLWVSYDHIQAVRGVSLGVDQGEIVALIGANGAGKSTILRAISGLQPVARGAIRYDGRDLGPWSAHRIAQAGIAHVPEGRGIFGTLTVLENLRLAAYGRTDNQLDRDVDRVFSLFPRLAERRSQWGSTLSGGEQQMLAIGRGLMSRPLLLILDEPTLGLSPKLAADMLMSLKQLNEQGITILLVSQEVIQSLQLSQRAYVLENGQIALQGTGEELSRNEHIRKAYLGM